MDVWPLPRISFRGLTSISEDRPVALITQPAAWAIVSKSVTLPLVIQAEPARDDFDFVEYLATNLPAPVKVIYAVGEGIVIDVAKVVASANDKELIIIPTAISSDVAFSPTATVHEDGVPSDEPTGPADEVIVDLDLIQSASPENRAAGIVEVLSVVTGLLDWANANAKGKLTPETKFTQWALGIAAGLGAQAIKIASALGKGEPEALHTLVDLLAMMTQLDNTLGHRRASQGIEHIFADVVKADPGVSHAEKVGAGILIASALHNKDTASIRQSIEAAGVRLNRLTAENIRAAVNSLPDFVKQNDLPYTVLHDLAANAPEIEQALTKSTLLTA
jgi:glycerol-1-phosphate dehydrogenase [NAD(P)+]